MATFIGVIFGMFGLGLFAPSLNAIGEGKAAAKMAFQTIDRKPEILIDDLNGI